MCQERGFELLESLYNKADRLKTVQVLMHMSVHHVSIVLPCCLFMYICLFAYMIYDLGNSLKSLG